MKSKLLIQVEKTAQKKRDKGLDEFGLPLFRNTGKELDPETQNFIAFIVIGTSWFLLLMLFS